VAWADYLAATRDDTAEVAARLLGDLAGPGTGGEAGGATAAGDRPRSRMRRSSGCG
jgi:hypothetical protein